MLKLSRAEPAWLDLVPGVRVRMRPVTSVAMVIARRDARAVLGEQGKPDVADHAGIALVRSLVHQGLDAWEGVGDQTGAEIPVTTEAVDALLDLWPAYDAFDRLYVGPALALDAEKNVSAS